MVVSQADAILGNPCLRRESLIPDLSRAEELRPYRRLDPDRLKLHGRANWDPVPKIGDELRMLYLEPDLLVWSDQFDYDVQTWIWRVPMIH